MTIELNLASIMKAVVDEHNKTISAANAAIEAVSQATARVNSVGTEMQEQVRAMERGGIIPSK